jgi:murein DD-endopeptidase MepM/ murein hydrolase activator NlpD
MKVKGSLAASLATELGKDGAELSAHLARIYMWDLDLRRDIVADDEVRLLWRTGEGGEVEIGAATYRSQRLGQVLRAYRYRPAGDESASYWDESGLERPRRLKNSPLLRYDQITALLKDRPTHQGMDFKTPVGTKVSAPHAGTVTRIDWKLRGNGHCIELRYDDGTLAKFLHLSAVKVGRGARVSPGQVIALTGNTGHSTAPHLHYQLNRGAHTLDPVDYHGVTRRRLAGRDLKGLDAMIATVDRSCGNLAR